MNATTVVEARDLDLIFQTGDGPVHALKDVNLSIDKGDFVSFIGPSGCGKTTFLRVMAALEQPTGGTVTVNGMSPEEARRKRAYGYVFQAAGLYPWRTIAGNIRLPLEIMGFSRAEQEERVARVLKLVDLEGFGEQVSLATLGRDAAARQHRPGAGLRCRYPADGRALRGAGRDRARPSQRAAAGALGAHRKDHRLRHPFDPRGGVSSPPASW